MPPVRTEKRQTTLPWGRKSDTKWAQIPTKATAVHRDVHFTFDKEWEDRASRLGSGTRKISFGWGFVLTRLVLLDAAGTSHSLE